MANLLKQLRLVINRMKHPNTGNSQLARLNVSPPSRSNKSHIKSVLGRTIDKSNVCKIYPCAHFETTNNTVIVDQSTLSFSANSIGICITSSHGSHPMLQKYNLVVSNLPHNNLSVGCSEPLKFKCRDQVDRRLDKLEPTP